MGGSKGVKRWTPDLTQGSQPLSFSIRADVLLGRTDVRKRGCVLSVAPAVTRAQFQPFLTSVR